jgi:hypothetical protein
MNDHDPYDEDLRTLLHDAVSDVHPDPALHRIRSRTATRPQHGSRAWLVGLAAAATAAAIAGVVVVTTQRGPGSDSGPVASPTTSTSAGPSASTAATTNPSTERAMGIYYVGDTPQGPRLYREFHRLRVADGAAGTVGPAIAQALDRADDSDYRDPWPDGTQASVQGATGSEVTLSLSNDALDLRDRPAGTSAAEAEAAVQQLVYTAQAALQQRLPVRFLVGGQPTDRLLGVDVSGPVTNGPALETLALVSISEPPEGVEVTGSFRASGVASSFEATVPWEIRKGDKVVKRGFSTASGWMDKLYPWQTDPIPVTDLPEGTYTFVASTDDPSNGEGAGPTSDTRTIVVRH